MCTLPLSIFALTCQVGRCQCGLETKGGEDDGLETDPTIQLDLTSVGESYWPSRVGEELMWRIMRCVCSIPYNKHMSKWLWVCSLEKTF